MENLIEEKEILHYAQHDRKEKAGQDVPASWMK
jgi:hypothetical protein